MPRLSVADCEALLRVIEERPTPSPDSLRVAARLRSRLEQAVRTGAGPNASPAQVRPPEARAASGLPSCTLHVCTSCRPKGAPREPREGRPGYLVYRALREAFGEGALQGRVDVRPAECLSVCPRPCGIALSSPGMWTYLFGDQRPGESTRDIVACVSLYLEAVDGLMPRAERPKSLRASVLGRVPPSPEQDSARPASTVR